jgi:hypothetical protein
MKQWLRAETAAHLAPVEPHSITGGPTDCGAQILRHNALATLCLRGLTLFVDFVRRHYRYFFFAERCRRFLPLCIFERALYKYWRRFCADMRAL